MIKWPLYLHVNQKSDDDDDDENRHENGHFLSNNLFKLPISLKGLAMGGRFQICIAARAISEGDKKAVLP